MPYALRQISMPYANALRLSYGYAVRHERALRPWFTRPPNVHNFRPCPKPIVTPTLRPTHQCPTLMGAPMSILPMPYAHDLRFMSIPPMPNAQAPCQCPTPMAHTYTLRPCDHSAHCPRLQHRPGRRAWAEGQVKDMGRVSNNMFL